MPDTNSTVVHGPDRADPQGLGYGLIYRHFRGGRTSYLWQIEKLTPDESDDMTLQRLLDVVVDDCLFHEGAAGKAESVRSMEYAREKWPDSRV
jgi:hypothetical protein